MNKFLLFLIFFTATSVWGVETTQNHNYKSAKVYSLVDGSELSDSEFYQAYQSEVKKSCSQFKDGSPQQEKCAQTHISKLSASDLEKLKKGMSESNNIQIKKDKAGFELTGMLTERLEKKLYGEKLSDTTLKTRKFVDHTQFINLYEQRTNDNVLLNITKYCMERYNPMGTGDHVVVNDNDVEQLKKDLAGPNGLKNAKDRFDNCVGSIPTNCKNDKDKHPYACNLMAKLKDQKNTLVALEKIKEKLKPLAGDEGGIAIGDNFDGIFTGNDTNNTLKDVSAVTSKDLREGTSQNKKYTDVLKSEAQAMAQACEKDPNSNDCKNFFQKDPKAKLDELTKEYNAKTFVQKREIELLDDESKIKKFLAEKGYDEKEIETIWTTYMKSAGFNQTQAVTNIREKYKQQYESERASVIANLQKQVDKIEKARAPANIDTTIDDLQKRSERLERLVHYTNIVTGLLDLQDQTTGLKDGTNIESLEREIGSSAYEADASSYFKDLSKEAKQTISKSSHSSSESSGFSALEYLKKNVLNIFGI
ncbi:MAG: hypothetical protein KBD63_03510 [Bacteriovoracaceae bacterium]|nr:hypothetical protein [Bacteriovoracaceae bacterium]